MVVGARKKSNILVTSIDLAGAGSSMLDPNNIMSFLFLQASYTENTASATAITVTAIPTTKQPAVGWDQQTDISFFQQSEIINNGNKS